jgi:hypothetical protein
LPGPFERHWGLLYYDGVVKYPLDLSGTWIPMARGVFFFLSFFLFPHLNSKHKP